MQTYTWGEITVTLDEDGTLHIPEATITNPTPISDSVPFRSIETIQIDGKLTLIGSAESLFWNLSSVSSIINIENIDTSNVTSMSGMFYGCGSLTTLNLNSFDTSNVTDMSWMFCDASGLTDLAISNFDTSKVTSMDGMFSYTVAIPTLDLSNFNTSNVVTMGSMFDNMEFLTSLNLNSFDTSNVVNMLQMFSSCFNLRTLTLGAAFKMNDTVTLPPVSSSDAYTGLWQNVGSGTIARPNGRILWTSDELMNHYNGATDSDVFVWQPILPVAKDLTINYKDTEGNVISDAKTISGNIGDPFDVSSEEYKLKIEGYSFKEIQGTATGTLSDVEQVVTYIYSKDVVKQGSITVHYLDEQGNPLLENIILKGSVGESFVVKAKNITNYILDTKISSKEFTGTFSEINQDITFTYKMNPDNKLGDLLVIYVDSDSRKR